MEMVAYALLSSTFISLLSFLGGALLPAGKPMLRRLSAVLFSYALGAFLANAGVLTFSALHEGGGVLPVFALFAAGAGSFFLLARLRSGLVHLNRPTTTTILTADGLHSLTDGVLIAAAYLIDIRVGLATTFAVVCHEAPHEISKFGLMVHLGLTPWRAMWYNFASSLTMFLGVWSVLLWGTQVNAIGLWLLPFVAGAQCAIALSGIRSLMEKIRVTDVLAILTGMGVILLAQWLAPHAHLS